MTIKEICTKVLADPNLQPEKDERGWIKKTKCNIAARMIAQELGCTEFDNKNLTAEDMGQIMIKNESGKWEQAGGAKATAHALAGGLGFAFMSKALLADEHAHIAAVYPSPEGFSGSLGKTVPMVCNVGKVNKEEPSSQAFPVSKGEADYYIWHKGEK